MLTFLKIKFYILQNANFLLIDKQTVHPSSLFIHVIFFQWKWHEFDFYTSSSFLALLHFQMYWISLVSMELWTPRPSSFLFVYYFLLFVWLFLHVFYTMVCLVFLFILFLSNVHDKCHAISMSAELKSHFSLTSAFFFLFPFFF